MGPLNWRKMTPPPVANSGIKNRYARTLRHHRNKGKSVKHAVSMQERQQQKQPKEMHGKPEDTHTHTCIPDLGSQTAKCNCHQKKQKVQQEEQEEERVPK